MAPVSVAVVIVSWNGRHHLEGCLPALRAQAFRDFSVILVDNGSTDGTVDFVRANYPEVDVVDLPENRGFAGPNNLGISRAFIDPSVRYVVTLNNDTRPEPGYLAELVACAGRHADAGAIQPKVVNYYEPTRIDSAGILISRDMNAVNRGLGETDTGQYAREEELFGASASAALYCREALEVTALPRPDGTVDYFDGDYFAYYEDVDLAWRLRLAGFPAYYAPHAVVWHVHSATGKSCSPFKAFYIHRNLFCNIIKNLPLRQLVRALVLMPGVYWTALREVVSGRGAAAEVADRGRGGEHPVRLVIRGWWQVLRMLPALLAKRSRIQAARKADGREIEHWFDRFAIR